jgi:hypothetical protein
MNRIFATLAVFSIVALVATLLLGFSIGDLNDPALRQSDQLPRLVNLSMIHKMAGLASALIVVLVNSIVVTYFVGTGRWCKEVVDTYSLDVELIRQNVAIKRRAFPWAVMAMLAIVGVSALGAAADPGRLQPGTENWVVPHLAGALVGIGFIACAYFNEAQRIREQQDLISEVLSEVKRIREERGLDRMTEEGPPSEPATGRGDNASMRSAR